MDDAHTYRTVARLGEIERPEFEPNRRGHQILRVLADAGAFVRTGSLREALINNPSSKNAVSKLGRALGALEANGLVTSGWQPIELTYAITDAGRAALEALDFGEAVFGRSMAERDPGAPRPSVRIFVRRERVAA